MTFVKGQFWETEITTALNCPKGITKESWYQLSALATLIYADWLPQVNGPPGVLPSKAWITNLCQHSYFADHSNLEESEPLQDTFR